MAGLAIALERLDPHIHHLPHDFAGKGVLSVLYGVLTKWYLPFQSYDSVVHTLCCKLASFYHLLHFAWGEMYIGHGRLCVCMSVCVSVYLSLAAFRYCTDSHVTWGMVGVPSSCALLGGFAIGARVSLLWRTRNISECLYSLYSALLLYYTDARFHATT